MENDQTKKIDAELQKTLDCYNAKLADHREFLEKMKADDRGVSKSKPVVKPSKKKKKKAHNRRISKSSPATKHSKSPFAGPPFQETDSEATTDEDEAHQGAKNAALLARSLAQNPDIFEKMKADNRSVSESKPATKPSKSPFAAQPSPETDSEATTDDDEADQLLARAHAQNPGQRVYPGQRVPEEPSWDEFMKGAEEMKKELQEINGGRGLEMLDMESIMQELEKMVGYSKAERDKEKKG